MVAVIVVKLFVDPNDGLTDTETPLIFLLSEFGRATFVSLFGIERAPELLRLSPALGAIFLIVANLIERKHRLATVIAGASFLAVVAIIEFRGGIGGRHYFFLRFTIAAAAYLAFLRFRGEGEATERQAVIVFALFFGIVCASALSRSYLDYREQAENYPLRREMAALSTFMAADNSQPDFSLSFLTAGYNDDERIRTTLEFLKSRRSNVFRNDRLGFLAIIEYEIARDAFSSEGVRLVNIEPGKSRSRGTGVCRSVRLLDYPTVWRLHVTSRNANPKSNKAVVRLEWANGDFYQAYAPIGRTIHYGVAPAPGLVELCTWAIGEIEVEVTTTKNE